MYMYEYTVYVWIYRRARAYACMYVDYTFTLKLNHTVQDKMHIL